MDQGAQRRLFHRPKAQLTQALATGDFGPGAVNAEDQWVDEGSLLNLVSRLAAIRLAHPGIGRRECRPIGDAPDSVIALRYADADHDLVVIHNLSAKAARLDLDLGASCRGEGPCGRSAGDGQRSSESHPARS
jgi:glycosidase